MNKQKPMIVRIELSIPIDRAAWMLNYGCEPEEVRDDVKYVVDQTVKDKLEQLGVHRASKGPSSNPSVLVIENEKRAAAA